MRRRTALRTRGDQSGVIAIIVGLSIVVLVGFAGLAIDGGRLYLTKTELQNAADSCALAASYELAGSVISPGAFARGTQAGVTVANQNRVGFQGTPIPTGNVAVGYGTSLAAGSAFLSADASPPNNSRYVRCTITQPGIAPFFMQVLGFGPQTVNALATATLAPSQSNCAVPLGLCVQPGSAAPDFGYVRGNWYGLDFSSTGGAANYTGNFRWIDFDPSSPTPGCSGGGAQELSCLMAGSGQCNLPPPIAGTCGTNGSSTPTPGCVGQNGNVSSMEAAYNSRFGLYGPGTLSVTSAPPDFTGYSYSTENWSPGRDAYGGTSAGGQPNLQAARAAHNPTVNVPGMTPPFFRNPYSASTQAQHAASGADRRVVVVPIVDCVGAGGFTGGQHAPIRAYACVLMLDPYRQNTGSGGGGGGGGGNNGNGAAGGGGGGGGTTVSTRLEYLGRSDAAGSPCATSGAVGTSTSSGPLVPALVQ